MCGIAGIFHYRDAGSGVDLHELRAMREHMRARGPDGAGEWVSEDRSVGLAHRRLSIIDLSEQAAQPMVSADGKRVVTFNGEIYNYRALRDELIARGRTLRTQSDTEVLLELYALEGEGMLQRLRGMFAFALYDCEARRLLLARDPYGIKPLYYADDGRTLRFASQVKALLAGGRAGRALDPAGQVGFLLFGSVPEPFTIRRSVKALPAGSTMDVRDGHAHAPRRYFSIAEHLRCGAERESQASALDAQAHVRAALLDSVRHHMVADVPVGVFLSAGIDSGTLVALMSEIAESPIEAVTLGFEEFAGKAEDEVPLASRVASAYGLRHEVRRVGYDEFEADLPAILDAMDQPSIDGINTWFVSKAAHEQGLKVALSGLGGDELFGGYPSFRDVPRWVALMRVPHAFPMLGRTLRAAAVPIVERLPSTSPKLAGLVEYGGTYAGAYLLRRGLFMPWELPGLLDRDTVEEGLERLQPEQHVGACLDPDPGRDSLRVAALEASLYMRNQLLRDCDWASMAHSLEVRVPLVDAVLLQELAPVLAARGGSLSKALIVGSASGPLPAELANKPKTGFGVPISRWLLRNPMLDGWRQDRRLSREGSHWSRRFAYALQTAFASP